MMYIGRTGSPGCSVSCQGKGREPTHENHQHRPVPRFPAVEQLAVIPPPLVRTGLGNVLDHLTVLQLHDRGVSIAITVVFCQHLERCFVFILRDEPTGGLSRQLVSMLSPCLFNIQTLRDDHTSGTVKQKHSTNPENTICNQIGIRQLIFPSIELVRHGMNVPGIPPPNHSTLYRPVIAPRYAGCAISET